MYLKIYSRDESIQNQIDELLKEWEGKTSSKVLTYEYELVENNLLKIESQEFKKFLYTVKWIDDFIDKELRKDNESFQIYISDKKDIDISYAEFENCLWLNTVHTIEEFESFSLVKNAEKIEQGIKFEYDFYKHLEWSNITKLKTKSGEVNTQVVRVGELLFTLTWVGQLSKKDLNIRVHHQCETSEIHGSVHCDCKEQLNAFQEDMYKKENHLLIYCHEEGRGAGIFNKVNAYYNTETHGDDTVDAYKRLGLKVEQRNFEVPADIIFQLGVESVIVWTNNPLKYEPIKARGIEVKRKSAWYKTDSQESKVYMDSKRARMGHHEDIYTIALVVTAGKRDLAKTLESINNQTVKVDEIIIASEVDMDDTGLWVIVNPNEKGIARNTMQALSRIKLKFPEHNVLIGTIDDDDEWVDTYVEKAKDAYKNGYNFITGYLDVFKDNEKFDEYKFKQEDIDIETFVYGNPGLHGSNKFFDLDIALESGGMMKHINASTDKTFNINLLSHPETKLFVIDGFVCKYHKDDNRPRITNDPTRLPYLQEFYKSFANFVESDRIKEINDRHEKLHNMKGVITWK